MKTNREEPDSEIEEVLGARGRIRILKFLVKNPRYETALSLFRLERLTGLKRGAVEKHLGTLLRWGWVEKIPIDGGKKYKLNRENVKVEALITFFKQVGYA